MCHLISSITEPESLSSVIQWLRSEYEELAAAVRRHLEYLRSLDLSGDGLGSRLKRTRVALNNGSRHDFSEIVNQMATLERLLDLLEWLVEQTRWTDLEVLLLNATTSSSSVTVNGRAVRNDLALRRKSDGFLLLFEVWDCARAR
jgi:hypothetical protein